MTPHKKPPQNAPDFTPEKVVRVQNNQRQQLAAVGGGQNQQQQLAAAGQVAAGFMDDMALLLPHTFGGQLASVLTRVVLLEFPSDVGVPLFDNLCRMSDDEVYRLTQPSDHEETLFDVADRIISSLLGDP